MRRILHITESLARTGETAQLLTLARGLAADGCDVHVVSLGTGQLAPEFRAAGISTTELRRRKSVDPFALVRLWRLMRTSRPDVIHTWNAAAGIYGSSVARACGIQNLVAGFYRIEPYRAAAARIFDRLIQRRAKRLVTSSCRISAWWADRLRTTSDSFATIAPGVPPAPPSDVSREELLRELSLPAGARLIGVIGRLVPEKRVKDLIWAADLLRVLHDNLRLLIIGDGPLRGQLEQYARMASDLDHIQFLGERSDVWRIMPHLDVLWNASENRAHSIAILEAMAAGVPVIGSDVPLNREFVAESETGYLIQQHERSGRADRARHTDRIFNDTELAARLSQNSRERATSKFNSEQMVKAYKNLYEESA